MMSAVLLSGGLDSATCLALAAAGHGAEDIIALSVYYGQKHVKEQECAQKLADYYKVPLYRVDLSSTMQYSNCTLLAKNDAEIAHGSYAEQLRGRAMPVSTYVPYRNGLMLSSAATLALSLFETGLISLYYGAHADDAAGNAYPDCTPAFTEYMSGALWEGSGHRILLNTPFLNKTKADVVAVGLKLKVPYELTWSCYEGGEKPCGKCGTCIDRAKAFEANGVKDPAIH